MNFFFDAQESREQRLGGNDRRREQDSMMKQCLVSSLTLLAASVLTSVASRHETPPAAVLPWLTNPK
eukprot:768334-Hanusia_phi.AAC.9